MPTISFGALVLGSVLGYGSPLVGVVLVSAACVLTVVALRANALGSGQLWTLLAIVLFGELLLLLGGLPLWLSPLPALAGAAYAFARDRPWWWAGSMPLWALQIAALQQRWSWGRATIDVFNTLQSGATHLMHGQNPYSFHYRDLAPLPTWHYVRAPFQYGPAVLYLGAPGHLLGDVRLLGAAAMAATIVALVVAARECGRPQLQRMVYLTASLPLWLPLIVNAWVDVYTAAGLAIWWALRERSWAWASVALGIGAAAKPVMLVGLLPLLVWHRAVRREVAVAALTALVLCLPFLVWTGPVNFVYAVAGVHVEVLNEIWPTSVTFNALLLKAHMATIPDAVSVLVLLLSVPAALIWNPRRRDIQLLVAVAFMLAALLLSKQSFLNYYFVVVVWLLLAIAEAPEQAAATEPEGEALRVQPALLH